MFGCLAAGRLVQTNLQQVDANKYVFVLPDAKSIHHVVVFLTGAQAFQPGLAATVHFGWPGADGVIGWQYLGFLANDKPSAVFKVSAYKAAIALEESTMVDGAIAAHIGIAIETVATVQRAAELAAAANAQSLIKRSAAQDADGPAAAAAAAAIARDPSAMVRRIVDHFYNYIVSYLRGPESEALARLVQAWYQSIETRIRTDPDFWKRESV